MISELLGAAVITVLALLPIANPFSTAALFLGLSSHMTEEERRAQARKACIYMFWILTAFLVAGNLIMAFFGISIPGLRLAGALVITAVGFKMLFKEDDGEVSEEGVKEASHKSDIAFTPLAMPSLSGPGAIAAVIGTAAAEDSIVGRAGVGIGIAACSLIAYLVLRSSSAVVRHLGVNGVQAVAKVMGFFLICIGVQFAIRGVEELVTDPEAANPPRIQELWPEAGEGAGDEAAEPELSEPAPER
jgi:multiple antibiotic resistance protein